MEWQATLNWTPWGYDPDKDKRAEDQKAVAEGLQKDPLHNFPNDILYFSKQQISDKLIITRRLGSKLPPEKRWDERRAEACFGKHGLEAKRCSMNDKLWALWRKSVETGSPLTLHDIKKMILLDLKRYHLYPPGWRDETASPPKEYLDELKSKGLLDKILSEIDEIAKA